MIPAPPPIHTHARARRGTTFDPQVATCDASVVTLFKLDASNSPVSEEVVKLPVDKVVQLFFTTANRKQPALLVATAENGA